MIAARVRTRWWQLVVLALAELLAMSLWFSGTAVVPQLAALYELSDGGRAWLTIAVQLGFVAGSLASALLNLADRWRAERLFAGSAAAAALLSAAIPALVPPFAAVLALRFLTGACLAGVYPPGMKLMATWFDRGRGLAIGALVGALTLGSATPHLFTVLAGLDAGGVDWRAVMLAASGCAMASAIIAIALVRAGPLLPPARRFSWSQAAAVVRVPAVRLATLGYLGHMWELYAMWAWTPLILADSFQRSGHARWLGAGAGFAAMAIGAVTCVVAGIAGDRVGRTAIIIASLAVSGACCLVAGFVVEWPWVLAAVCLVWGAAVVADSAQYSAAVSELGDQRYVGTALTAQTCLGFLLTTATIRLVPALERVGGWELALATLALGPAAGIWAIAVLRARPEAVRMASGRR